MNTFMRSVVALGCLGLAATASAQTVTVQTVAGEVGGMVTVDINFEGSDTLVFGLNILVDLDAALAGSFPEFAPGFPDCGNAVSGTVVCGVDGQTVSLLFANAAPIQNGRIGRFNVDIDGGVVAPASLLMDASEGGAAGGIGGSDLPAGTVTYVDGAVTIADTLFSSLSNSGDVALTAPVNGSDSDTITFTAADGTVNDISCSASGDSEISFSGSAPTSTDGSFDIGVSCSSDTADTYNASYTCDYTPVEQAKGAPASTTANVTCDVAAGLAQPAFDPADGGTLIIGGLIAGAGGSANVTFSEIADQGTGYSVDNCRFDDGSDFSVSPTSLTVAAGGSSQATITVGGVASVVSDTLRCDVTANGATDEYAINVTVGFRPLVVPTLQQWGMILMALALAGFGFMTLRRRDV